MVKITGVEPRGRAHKNGILAGDNLLSINGREIRDVLDYRFFLTDTEVELLLSREGEEFKVNI